MQGHVYGKHTHFTLLFLKGLGCLMGFSFSIDIFKRRKEIGAVAAEVLQ